MNLYELTSQFQAAMDALEINEETGEVSGFEVVDSLDVAFEDKAEAYALTIKNLLAFAGEAKTEADKLKSRADQAKRQADSMKLHLAQSMSAVGKTKIETPRAALSFRRSTQVKILDDTELPEDVCKVVTERKPDKTVIKKLLQDGMPVPGAELVVLQNLQIK